VTVHVSTAPSGPAAQTGLGVIVPYDMALDREMWRWMPEDVTLFFTRTPYSPLPVTVEMAEHVSDANAVRASTRDLIAVAPAVYAYGCTSGSFVRGVAGERQLVEAMREAGAPAAVTASGALLQALAQLGAQRVAIATPYDPDVTERLRLFLYEAGVEVVGSSHLGLTADIWSVPYARTAELVAGADGAQADAIVVSCTNLPTYDLIAPLEARLGKPVVSANQATMWAALRAVGRRAVGPGQRLLDTDHIH
jgi:maleate isomerase